MLEVISNFAARIVRVNAVDFKVFYYVHSMGKYPTQTTANRMALRDIVCVCSGNVLMKEFFFSLLYIKVRSSIK